jgi:hypothetical protein
MQGIASGLTRPRYTSRVALGLGPRISHYVKTEPLGLALGQGALGLALGGGRWASCQEGALRNIPSPHWDWGLAPGFSFVLHIESRWCINFTF